MRLKKNKPIYIGKLILDISKTLLNFGMITLNQSIKTEQNYVNWIVTALSFMLRLKMFMRVWSSNNVEKWFDTSNYDENDKRPLPIGKNKEVIGLFKDGLGKKITIEFVGLRAITYAYVMVDDSEHNKAKGTKTCLIKRRLMVKNYKDCLFDKKNNIKIVKKI